MPRGSQHSADEIVSQTTGVRLGGTGLDLRQPSDPGTLSKLLNARFLDDRTLVERDGHLGTLVRDASDFAPLGANYAVSDEWVYGHGLRVSSSNASGWENAHHPIAGRAAGVFQFDGTDVMWTGDRLLVKTASGPCIGNSAFWNRSTIGAPLAMGLPAFLPLQVDSFPPADVTGEYVETCLTPTLRVNVRSNTGELDVWVMDRATGALLHTSSLLDDSEDPVEVKVLSSSGTPVVLWRDFDTQTLYMNYWTGAEWAGEDEIATGVIAYDFAVTADGFHVAWHQAVVPDVSAAVVKFGRFTGPNGVNTPYAFATEAPGLVPTAAMAVGVSPSGELAVLAETASGLQARVYSPALTALTSIGLTTIAGSTGWGGGLAICSRGLKESNGYHDWVIHAARSATAGVYVRSMHIAPGSGVTLDSAGTRRYNSTLASKSFRVGDEVFCWLRSENAGTHYLIAGVVDPQVCGYADREEAVERTTHDGNYGIPHVLPDPLDEEGVTFTWARPFNTGQTYAHGGDVRIGDVDFLPEMSAAAFGKSVYLSGSAVRNYDGIELGDAGFQDYPIVRDSPVQTTGGSLTNTGDPEEDVYYFRVYPVRYNSRGERFMGSAVSYGPVAMTDSNNKLALTIATLPSTSHDDVVFEVYRTEALGTTFYLEGHVENDLTAASVGFVSTLSDDNLRDQLGDSHAAGIGAQSEIEEWGPIGCKMLAVSGDRLWGAGGQVPAGQVQFSKLYEAGEGAGFDDLAGFQTVDTQGNEVVSLIGSNDATVAFQRDQLNVIVGTGPDNYGRGGFTIPQIVLADGAITHRGTIGTQLGVLFWGADGPRLLTTAFSVQNISAPIRALTTGLAPTGVRVSLSKQEVVWYTSSGTAILWNYQDSSRWAQWSGLEVAGCSTRLLATLDGRLLKESPDAVGDDGQGFPFVWRTGSLRPEQLLLGGVVLKEYGVTGVYHGPHNLRFRVFYNGSPLWSEESVWEPAEDTWLAPGDDVSTLTPAQIDALAPKDRSGAYMTHKRVSRQHCSFFQIEVSNIEAHDKTYTPFELALELGVTNTGLGRVPVNNFTTTVGGRST